MRLKYKKQLKLLNEILKIKKVVSIRFSDTKENYFKKYNDTACTSLARVFKNDACTYIDRTKGQLCSGGNHFLNINKATQKEFCDVYVKDEQVFKDDSVCKIFSKKLPKYFKKIDKKYILFTPLIKEMKKPDVVIFLVNPAQANRLIGLVNFDDYKKIDFLPNQPTCISLFAPLTSGIPHINFIDYYDRYYQGKVSDKHIWSENKMLISLDFKCFEKIIKNINVSAQGNYIPNIFPKEVDMF